MFNAHTRRFSFALLSVSLLAAASFAGPPDSDAPVDPVPETPGPGVTQPGLEGDFNNDCTVNYDDIEFIMSDDRFATEYSFGDILLVFSNWGATCNHDAASGAGDPPPSDSDAAVTE